MRHIPNQRLPVTLNMLHDIVNLCDTMHVLGKVIKCAILFGFYGFLRQSNLTPASHTSFDPTRNTCRGDVIMHRPGLVLILKWSKTSQSSCKHALIPLPEVHRHELCPVAAFQTMVKATPARPNEPLFLIPRSGRYVTLTTGTLSKLFNALLTDLGYNLSQYSLHSLRRGGATAAYQAGADFLNIQRHGTWSSDSFWRYISTEGLASSQISKALSHHVALNC